MHIVPDSPEQEQPVPRKEKGRREARILEGVALIGQYVRELEGKGKRKRRF